MRNSALVTILASAAVASAQVTVNNGTYTCSKPNAAFCAGNSLGTDIIIRCDANGNGQPGRCSDNLAGEPPVGDSTALCYQSDATSGDAACEKNCVVYAASGSSTLPTSLCTPTYTSTTSGTASKSTVMETTTNTITSCSGGCPTTTPYRNTTMTTSSQTTGSTTKTTAVGPTTTGSSGSTTVPTAGAAANVGGVVLAGLGMAAAFLL